MKKPSPHRAAPFKRHVSGGNPGDDGISIRGATLEEQPEAVDVPACAGRGSARPGVTRTHARRTKLATGAQKEARVQASGGQDSLCLLGSAQGNRVRYPAGLGQLVEWGAPWTRVFILGWSSRALARALLNDAWGGRHDPPAPPRRHAEPGTRFCQMPDALSCMP
jgi:hypothetical protein